MKRVLALAVFVSICCTLFLPPSVAVAVEEGQLGVFFATRDLDEPWTNIYPSDASREGYGGRFIVVDSKDSFWHRPCRHCFLLFGKLLVETTDKLLIEVIAARGFSRIMENGKLTKKTEDGDETEWLLDLDKRSKFTVSCTPFMLEGMPVVKRDGSTVLATEDDVIEIWNRCYTAFKKKIKTENEYHGLENNCCTIAYESLRQVTWESDSFNLIPNLLRINIRDYNVLGMGIGVRDIDYSRDAMERGHTRLFRDLILYAWRIAMPPSVSVCDVKQLGECRAVLRKIEDELIQNSVQRYGMELTEIIERIERKSIFAKSFFAKAQELHRRKTNSSSCPETSPISLALSSGDICKEALDCLTWYWTSSSINSFSVIYSNTDGNFTNKEMFWDGNWYCLH